MTEKTKHYEAWILVLLTLVGVVIGAVVVFVAAQIFGYRGTPLTVTTTIPTIKTIPVTQTFTKPETTTVYTTVTEMIHDTRTIIATVTVTIPRGTVTETVTLTKTVTAAVTPAIELCLNRQLVNNRISNQGSFPKLLYSGYVDCYGVLEIYLSKIGDVYDCALIRTGLYKSAWEIRIKNGGRDYGWQTLAMGSSCSEVINKLPSMKVPVYPGDLEIWVRYSCNNPECISHAHELYVRAEINTPCICKCYGEESCSCPAPYEQP